MTVHSEPCGDESLRLLLSGDETSEEYGLAAKHVETCAVCQSRLTTLAADASWWHEVQSLLDDEWDHRWEPDTSDPSLFTATPDTTHDRESTLDTVRRLLGAPRHPELLGRIGRYDVERVIGQGGMGIVLKAHDTELNRPVAIKLLASHLAHVGAARKRFAREGRAAAAVVHEHVVAIYNVESEGQVPFQVMQYVPGRSLQARVDEDGPLVAEEILRIGMQAAAGLAAAHRQGIVHRDVKPSNILLEDTVERAVLTDFGLARALDDASMTQTSHVAGTPHYMSPEQAAGESIDHRSDLFSLGAVLYFMATGHPPFRAASSLAVLNRICHEEHCPVWQSNQNIPDELSDLIDRLLAKKPSRRLATSEEAQAKLAQLLSRWQQHGLNRRQRWRRSARRLRRVVVRLAALVLVAAGLGLWLSSLWQAETSQPRSNESTEALMAPIVDADRQFLTELEQLKQAMTIATRETFYLQQGLDSWARELEALKEDVAEFESTNP